MLREVLHQASQVDTPASLSQPHSEQPIKDVTANTQAGYVGRWLAYKSWMNQLFRKNCNTGIHFGVMA